LPTARAALAGAAHGVHRVRRRQGSRSGGDEAGATRRAQGQPHGARRRAQRRLRSTTRSSMARAAYEVSGRTRPVSVRLRRPHGSCYSDLGIGRRPSTTSDDDLLHDDFSDNYPDSYRPMMLQNGWGAAVPGACGGGGTTHSQWSCCSSMPMCTARA
jgi:hypothetical protein